MRQKTRASAIHFVFFPKTIMETHHLIFPWMMAAIGRLDIAYFLLSYSHGHYGDKEKVRLITEACCFDELDVGKKLFEHHNSDSIPGKQLYIVLIY